MEVQHANPMKMLIAKSQTWIKGIYSFPYFWSFPPGKLVYYYLATQNFLDFAYFYFVRLSVLSVWPPATQASVSTEVRIDKLNTYRFGSSDLDLSDCF